SPRRLEPREEESSQEESSQERESRQGREGERSEGERSEVNAHARERAMKVLVTGGAGYVGCILVPQLLARGHQVRVLDDLMYGGRGLLACFAHRGFEFMKGSVLDEGQVARALDGADAVIHLAGIVGYPACKRDPRLAREVNLEGTRLIERLRAKDQPIVFASTGSNYGAVVGAL